MACFVELVPLQLWDFITSQYCKPLPIYYHKTTNRSYFLSFSCYSYHFFLFFFLLSFFLFVLLAQKSPPTWVFSISILYHHGNSCQTLTEIWEAALHRFGADMATAHRSPVMWFCLPMRWPRGDERPMLIGSSRQLLMVSTRGLGVGRRETWCHGRTWRHWAGLLLICTQMEQRRGVMAARPLLLSRRVCCLDRRLPPLPHPTLLR